MRRITFAIAMLAAAAAFRAGATEPPGWNSLTTASDGHVRVYSQAFVGAPGDYPKLWVRIDSDGPELVAGQPPTKIVLYEANCSQAALHVLQTTVYMAPSLADALPPVSNHEVNWLYPVPGTVAETVLFGACLPSQPSSGASASTASSRPSAAAPLAPPPQVAAPCAENGSCYGDVSTLTGNPKTVAVRGYYRSDGTYVRGHYRSPPRH